MLRIVWFLVIIALAAAGAAWVAEQPGDVVLAWRSWRAEMSLPVFVLAMVLIVAAILLGWALLSGLLRMPSRMRLRRQQRRQTRARHAITHGLLAIGHGDSSAARSHANAARRHAPQDPLALLLQAQTAQLEGDSESARRAFVAMTGHQDTKSLGMRGLYIEAQRAGDPYAALTIAEEALRASPESAWASDAVLAFRSARADWTGALEILDGKLGAGLIDKKAYRRLRGVLLTAQALEVEDSDPSLSRDSVLEAIKLAPTLVPAAVLASGYLTEAFQIRRAMKILEVAWQAHPHPDIADAYAYIKAGDTAAARLARVESLIAKNRDHRESALALARAASDAGQFAKARAALAPLLDNPTQRVAILMAEIEHREHGDSAGARGWMLRAIRAANDPVWVADGYVSERWLPVSPVTGELDAFRWQVPLAGAPTNRAMVIDAAFEEALLAPPNVALAAAPQEPATEPATAPSLPPPQNPPAAGIEAVATESAAPPASTGTEKVVPISPLLQRRQGPAPVAPVIPIVRPPDDPGVDDSTDDFGDGADGPLGQPNSWRGYRPRRDS